MTRHIEDDHAQALWRRAQLHPVTRQYLYHVPNGGKRNPKEAARLAGQGVRPGVHDFHLPVAAGQYIGLWIELKAPRPHKSERRGSQIEWQRKMRLVGHMAEFAYGWFEAWQIIEQYLALGVRKGEGHEP